MVVESSLMMSLVGSVIPPWGVINAGGHSKIRLEHALANAC